MKKFGEEPENQICFTLPLMNIVSPGGMFSRKRSSGGGGKGGTIA
jgi:hypothetical protein